MAFACGHSDSHDHSSPRSGSSHAAANGVGELVLLGDNGQFTPLPHGWTSSGGSRWFTPGSAPQPTLVGAKGGLQIKLIWDSSIASAPAGFMKAAMAAEQLYASDFSNPEVINIQVGYGEVAGSQLPLGALAASESVGYLEHYSTVRSALQRDASSSTWQPPADASLPSSDPTNGGSFFVTGAEAKAL